MPGHSELCHLLTNFEVICECHSAHGNAFRLSRLGRLNYYHFSNSGVGYAGRLGTLNNADASVYANADNDLWHW